MTIRQILIKYLLIVLLFSCSEESRIFSSEEEIVDEIIFEPFWMSYSNYVWAFEYVNPDLNYFDFYSTEIYNADTGEILGYQYKIITLYKDKIFIRANKEIIEKNTLPTKVTIKRLY